MIKKVLLIALCVPSVWIACQQVSEMVAALKVHDPEMKIVTAAPAILHSNAQAILGSAAPMRAILMGLDGQELPEPSSELARAIFDHANARKKARERLAVKKNEITTRASITSLIGKLQSGGRPGPDRREECDDLERALDEYRDNPGRDEVLYQSARRLVEKIKRERERPENRPYSLDGGGDKNSTPAP